MPRNVEIKARLGNVEELRARAAALSDRAPEVIEQEDIFFNVPRGRLKLRILTPTSGQLIFYERTDRAGPKISTYSIVETDQPHKLKVVLAAAYGIRNAVGKTRECHMHGRTRIHVDHVDSLGNFLELEVILEETEDERVGEIEIYELMKKLGLNEIQLIEGAYVDLLEQGAQ
jgi:predicted adenylyl cyclase CyaB